MTNDEAERQAAYERQDLKAMCLECADDLARWALAFAAQDEPLLATLLEGLQSHFVKRAAVISV